MRVLLTGATGRLGRAPVPRLVQAGHDLRATSRRAHPGQHGVEWRVADLASGAGLAQAVAGVDAVVHLASAPYKGAYTVRVDVDGTRRLAATAWEAGVEHLLYASIVGIDRVPWPYFRRKLAAEELLKSGGMGWSIVRATQFHAFLDTALTIAAKAPVLVIDPGIPVQPVNVQDVADWFVARVARWCQQPGRGARRTARADQLRGPRRLAAGARCSQAGAARAPARQAWPCLRSGYLVTSAQPTGKIPWGDYLQETYGEPASPAGDPAAGSPTRDVHGAADGSMPPLPSASQHVSLELLGLPPPVEQVEAGPPDSPG